MDEDKRLTKEAQGYETDIVDYQAEVKRCALRWLVLCCSSGVSEFFYRRISEDVRLLPLASYISIDSKFLFPWIDQEITFTYGLHCYLFGMYGPLHSIFILIVASSQMASAIFSASFLAVDYKKLISKLGPTSFNLKAYSHNLHWY